MPTKYVVTEYKGKESTILHETMDLKEAREMVISLIKKRSGSYLIVREEGFPSSIHVYQ